MVELKKSPSPESLNNCFQLIQLLLELYQEYDDANDRFLEFVL